MRKRILISLLVGASLALSTSVVSAGTLETATVRGQGPAGPTIAGASASIMRTDTSVIAKVVMDTPEAGSYTLGAGATGSQIHGSPAAFSLWVFVFFNPEECAAAVCGPGDLINDPDVVAGAFNAGGHIVGGPNLNLSGSVNASRATFGGPNAETIGQALDMGYNLADADIHLAVAPHGVLTPALLPEQISTPVGTPANWWLAFFD
ncbi:MAG TPA: hypothetical protein VF114_04715 [Candidatus Limnocylindria bacterium]